MEEEEEEKKRRLDLKGKEMLKLSFKISHMILIWVRGGLRAGAEL